MKTEDIFKKYSKGNIDAGLKVISLGVGVQSTALYLMSSMGYKVQRADVAIFADPGAEHKNTYKTLEWLLDWKDKNNGIEIVVNSEKNLLKEILHGKAHRPDVRFAAIPAFGSSGGMLLRQCTGDYKIQPVKNSIRKILGIKKHKRMKPVEMWLGITTDEIQRMKESRMYNIKNFYPLIYHAMSRKDCIDFYKDNNFPIPPKSSCVFCPFHSNGFWKEIKEENGNAWKTSIKVDRAIRDSSQRGKEDKVYLHPSCKPLEDINFEDNQLKMFDGFDCEGHCGI